MLCIHPITSCPLTAHVASSVWFSHWWRRDEWQWMSKLRNIGQWCNSSNSIVLIVLTDFEANCCISFVLMWMGNQCSHALVFLFPFMTLLALCRSEEALSGLMDKLKPYKIKLQGCCRNVDSVRKHLEIPLESRVKQVNIWQELSVSSFPIRMHL